MSQKDQGNWESRWHPLLEQWVIISANTSVRPWSGKLSKPTNTVEPTHDPECYLCPRVKRANGELNPDYTGARAMDNDFPSLSMAAPVPQDADNELFRRSAAHGRCRVLCWSEKHNLTLAELSAGEMRDVVDLWCSEFTMLSDEPAIKYILIFENKGAEVGASNMHPHGQIYAYPFVTDIAKKMRASQAGYSECHNGCGLMIDLMNAPQAESLVVEPSKHCSVVVPFAARFSYETWVVPHRQVTNIAELNDAERADLARMYQRQTQRYDALFKRKSPNITLLHNAPCDNHPDNRHWHFHIAMQPPLRDPEKVKYLAGAEAGSNNIVNPLKPEHAAELLRGCAIQ